MEHIAKAYQEWYREVEPDSWPMGYDDFDVFSAGYELGFKAASAWEEERRGPDFLG